MKLQLIVPHYTEEPKWVLDFLDSVQLQRFVDSKDFEVLLINDGDQVVLDENLFKQYNFSIKYFIKPWGGLSDTRQYGQDRATADYVMFCDCDDMFSGVDSLYTIIKFLTNTNYDIVASNYIHGQEDGSIVLETAKNSSTQPMVHGKIFNRRFLLDHMLNWDKEIKIMHEDYYFYSQVLAENPKIGLLNATVYYWRYRANSVSNHDAFWWRGEEINRLSVEYKVLVEIKKRKAYSSFKLKLIDIIFNCYFLYPSANKYNKEEFIKDIMRKTLNTFRTDVLQLTSTEIKNRLTSIGISHLTDLLMYPVSFKGWLAMFLNEANKKESQ